MNLQEKKTLLKAFIFVFLVSFLIINWSDVSWLFNYKFISSTLSNFFQKDNHQQTIVNFNNGNEAKEDKLELEKFNYSDKENSLEIPKIGISAPLVIGESSEVVQLKDNLDEGVVLYPKSVLPGQKGETIILGHSAPENWPKINHDWVFSELNNLEEGDKIFLYFNNREYNYRVGEKDFLEKGEEIPQIRLTGSSNMLVLVSCWPPGKDYKRIVVRAELIIN